MTKEEKEELVIGFELYYRPIMYKFERINGEDFMCTAFDYLDALNLPTSDRFDYAFALVEYFNSMLDEPKSLEHCKAVATILANNNPIIREQLKQHKLWIQQQFKP